VYIARGNLYAVQGEVDRAIADYDTAITLDPNRAVAFFNRATALMEKGEIDRAIFDFDHAIELDPTDADARVGRGRAYYQKRDYAAALTDYDAAIRLVPDNPEALAERGDANERAGLYDRLIAIEPGNAKAWNNSCWDRAVLGRLEEALADCNEALRLAPNDPANLDSRGFTYLKLGRFEQAIADYDAALAHNPRDPGSLYGRGLARLRGQNDPEGGRASEPQASRVAFALGRASQHALRHIQFADWPLRLGPRHSERSVPSCSGLCSAAERPGTIV
jgi:tetratricopeptide (TPR) repeat protein